MLIAIFFIIQLVIFNGNDHRPSPLLGEKVCYFRRNRFVDEPLIHSAIPFNKVPLYLRDFIVFIAFISFFANAFHRPALVVSCLLI